MSLLSEYLSSKGKPIIYNGKLLMHNKKVIYAKKNHKFKTMFYISVYNQKLGRSYELNLSSPYSNADIPVYNENTLLDLLKAFDNKYSSGWVYESFGDDFSIETDMFTGAVVIKTALYEKMMSPDFFRTDRQSDQAANKVRAELMLEYIANYYEIYTHLFNKRLMAPYIPAVIKGHLVAGLFQPIRCSSSLIRSPFDYPMADEFFSILKGKVSGAVNGSDDIEIILSPSEEVSVKCLRLSCVSMFEFAHRFYPPKDYNANSTVIDIKPLREMDRRNFMFIILYVYSMIVSRGLELNIPLGERQPARMDNLNSNRDYLKFIGNLYSAYNQLTQQIVTT